MARLWFPAMLWMVFSGSATLAATLVEHTGGEKTSRNH